MTWWFYFYWAEILTPSSKKLTSYIFSVGLLQTTVTQIPSPALYCHLSPAAARPCMTLIFFFPRVMKWFDSAISAFRKVALKKKNTALQLFSFLSTLFSVLVSHDESCKDLEVTWLQSPLPGLCLIPRIPFFNPCLMDVLAKSTTEIKAVKLVKPCLFG